MGTQSVVSVTIIRDHRRLFLLSVLTSQKDPDLNRPVADLLTRLTLHVQRAFQHDKNASLGSVFGEKDHMLASSNQTGFIIVGEGPRLKIISPMAEKMIKLGYGIARSTRQACTPASNWKGSSKRFNSLCHRQYKLAITHMSDNLFNFFEIYRPEQAACTESGEHTR